MGSGNTTPVRQFSVDSPALDTPAPRRRPAAGPREGAAPGQVFGWGEVEGRSNRTLLPPLQGRGAGGGPRVRPGP
jgi:hypothetical protein